MLQAQSSRGINLRQTCHEFPEESSKIVPLGAPPFIGSDPDARVTQPTKDTGNTVAPSGFSAGFSTRVSSETITASPPPIVPREIFLTRVLAIC
jgi:hypothetical protein